MDANRWVMGVVGCRNPRVLDFLLRNAQGEQPDQAHQHMLAARLSDQDPGIRLKVVQHLAVYANDTAHKPKAIVTRQRDGSQKTEYPDLDALVKYWKLKFKEGAASHT